MIFALTTILMAWLSTQSSPHLAPRPDVPPEFIPTADPATWLDVEPESQRYKVSYEAFWWNCALLRSQNLRAKCPFTCSGTPAETAGCAQGAVDADDGIGALVKRYGASRSREYFQQLARTPGADAKLEPYFGTRPVPEGDSSAASSSADELLAEITSQGPRAVVDRLVWNESQFDAIGSQIETGAADWLQIALLLKPVSDAHASEGLDLCVARALPRAPSRVLRLVGHGFSLDHVCTSPFIEPEPGVVEEYERRALRALAGFKGSTLEKVAAECSDRVRLPTK